MRELERDHPADAGRDAGVAAVPAAPAPVAAGLERLAVIGAGRAGKALAAAAANAGLEPVLGGREDALDACRNAEAVLLCVPDAAIEDACSAISTAVPPLRAVGHVSGATGLDALVAAAERGALTFSLHPLQTLPDGDADLRAAPCAVAGSNPEAERFGSELAERLGMRPFSVPEEHRASYHAAASIASNFLVALEESAADLIERGGIEDGRSVLAPLVLRSAANWAAHGADALTGPIARGDEETVERHREALAETAPELLELYDALAARTRAVAEDQKAGNAAPSNQGATA